MNESTHRQRARSNGPHGPDWTSEVATALPEALRIGAENAPGPMARALGRIFGAAARHAMRRALGDALRGLNRFVITSFTLRGWRWRVESWVSGRPLADVIRAHDAVCPVEQVFLMHRETGLLLQQMSNPETAAQDGDLISSMLAAIRDFVRDSFQVGPDDSLRTIEAGNLTVFVEQGPVAVLAGTVRGPVPITVRDVFRDTLRVIHREMAADLGAFQGDTAAFDAARPYLASCLNVEALRMDRHLSLATWLALAAPVVAVSWWGRVRAQEWQRWDAFVGRLSREPGIVVVDQGRGNGRFHLSGMRDPLAMDPADILPAYGLAPEDADLRWASYHALEERLCLARAIRLLAPPPTVKLSIAAGTLYAAGKAPAAWLEESRRTARVLPGLGRYVTDGVTEEGRELTERWQAYVRRLVAEPGIVVVEQGPRDGKFHLTGMRDPLAMDPAAILQESGLNAADVDARWSPYASLEPSLVLIRAKLALQAPEGVTLSYQDGTLLAEGAAPHRWIAAARVTARALPGVARLDLDKLADEDHRELYERKRTIEGQIFHFLVGSPSLWPGQTRELAAFVRWIAELDALTRKMGAEYKVEVRGHTSASGDEAMDRRVSQELAERFLDLVKGQVVNQAALTPRGMGSAPPDVAVELKDPDKARLVSFRVALTVP
jgi:outer membrane protein OmpA-like peptidoglycan-associated protein